MRKIRQSFNKVPSLFSGFFRLILIILLLVFIVYGIKHIFYGWPNSVSENSVTDIKPTPTPGINADEIFELTNQERISNNFKPFKRDNKLDEAAFLRARYIVESGEFSHEATSSGLTYTKTIRKVNYWNSNYGENLSEGFYSSKTIVDSWMNSPKHRENILNPIYQDIGIATYSGLLTSGNTIVTVQLFGGYTPPNYTSELINSWEAVLASLKNVQPSWLDLKNKNEFYEKNKTDIDRMNAIISYRIISIEGIVSQMRANKYLTDKQNKYMSQEDKALADEANSIAQRLNNQ